MLTCALRAKTRLPTMARIPTPESQNQTHECFQTRCIQALHARETGDSAALPALAGRKNSFFLFGCVPRKAPLRFTGHSITYSSGATPSTLAPHFPARSSVFHAFIGVTRRTRSLSEQTTRGHSTARIARQFPPPPSIPAGAHSHRLHENRPPHFAEQANNT